MIVKSRGIYAAHGDWTAEYLSNLEQLSQEQYRMQCTCHLKPGSGTANLSVLNTHMFQQFINSLSHSEPAELSAKTIKNVCGMLHKAPNQAVESDTIKP